MGYSKHNFFFRLNDTVFISGIEGEIFKVITNMYNGIKSCITINGASSGYFTCEKVVRRWGGGGGGGRVAGKLSPLLFAIYLNDLENFMNSSGCRSIEIMCKITNLLYSLSCL